MTTQAPADAIQEDVSDVEPAVALRSNREIAMEQIELANMRRMEEEHGGKLVSVEDKGLNPPKDVEFNRDEPIEEAPAPKVRTVKIDGEERTVTDDELVRSYQKNQAADRRLEEAAQLLRAANERAAQLEAQIQSAPPATVPPAQADEDLRAEVKNTLSVIYGGDEEAAAEALTNLLTKNRGGDQPTPPVQQPSVDELADAVQRRLEVDTAFATLKTDYPDLVTDPNLEQLTAMRVREAVAGGMPPAQAILESAASIYRSLGKEPTGRQPAPVAPPKTNTRQENKERLEPVRAASSSAVLPEVAAEEGDPSSVIQEMAARRLGQSLPRRTG